MSPEQHLDLDALADVLADDPSLGAEEHVAGCAQCRTALDELRAAQTQMREELGALPAVPMPVDVAARISDALRDEAPTAPTVADDAAPATTTVTPFPTAAPDATRANPARWLAAAAAVVVLLAGGLYGISRLGDDSGSATSASSGAGGTEAAPKLDIARNSSGTDYTDRASLSAAVTTLLAGRAADSALTQQAPAATTPQNDAGAKTLTAPDPLAPLRDNKGLAECLLALLPPDDPSVQPLAIDYATFRGSPAMVVLLPGAVENKLDVFVVGPGCSRANDSVLFYTSVDKP
jgi:hypothetical protein